MTELQIALTPVGAGYKYYPPFINLRTSDGLNVIVTLRGDEKADCTPGAEARATFPKSELEKFLKQAAATLASTATASLSEDQIKHMVDRFLGWRLPEDFSPDGGITFKRLENRHRHPEASPLYPMPSGTNLFDATQAEAMVRHMIEGLPLQSPARLAAADVIEREAHENVSDPADDLTVPLAIRLAEVGVERDKRHRVAMEAGAVTCKGGGHIYPLRDWGKQLEAQLERWQPLLEKSKRELLLLCEYGSFAHFLAEQIGAALASTDSPGGQNKTPAQDARSRDHIGHTCSSQYIMRELPDPNCPACNDPLNALVARFAKALLAKLKLAEANGRSGWERDDWETQCRQGLLHHVEKGDPRDVAAYCAFMWHHGWATAPRTAAASDRQPQYVVTADWSKLKPGSTAMEPTLTVTEVNPPLPAATASPVTVDDLMDVYRSHWLGRDVMTAILQKFDVRPK
ncbi:hypothetical protein [Bradyrhizobium sp. SEMIA]|uniref:hypothetical protein n=1 Tax=Bradyrhizobium sp. SEMIA TaxID=2597515 RepID=UPI00223F62C5|nr:hypothetical protein [Bradyrhizobium sp. SEMIA]